MIKFKQNTTLVGVSEFRTKPDKIFNEMKNNLVMLEKHGKPVAVLMSVKEFEEMKEMLDFVEDYTLGMLAKERDKKHKNPKWISIEEAMKRTGLKRHVAS